MCRLLLVALVLPTLLTRTRLSAAACASLVVLLRFFVSAKSRQSVASFTGCASSWLRQDSCPPTASNVLLALQPPFTTVQVAPGETPRARRAPRFWRTAYVHA
jgi:hypothetical protein